MNGEKPNTGKVVKIKRVVKQPTPQTAIAETSLESIPRNVFDEIASKLNYKISKELAIGAEKQWRLVGGDENKLPGIAKDYLHQADRIREEYDEQLASNSLDGLLHSVQQTKAPNIPEGYVSQREYVRLKEKAEVLEKALQLAHENEIRLNTDLKSAEKAFLIAHQNETDLETKTKAYKSTLDESASNLQAYSGAKEAEIAALQTTLKEHQTEYKLLQLIQSDTDKELIAYKQQIKDLEAEIKSEKTELTIPTASLTDEEKDKQYQDEIKALKEQNLAYENKFDAFEDEQTHLREELANAYGAVTLLENRLHDYKVATAGETTKETPAEIESVPEGQEFSAVPRDIFPYIIHPEFGLVTIEERDGAILRYQPAGNGCIFDVDSRRNIDVGKDYERFVKIHKSNLDKHIYGKQNKSTKLKLSGREKRALDSEE